MNTKIGHCHGGEYLGPLHIHHINPRANGGMDDPNNLVALCPNCHAIQHSAIYLCDNAVARQFASWLSDCHEIGKFICYRQMTRKLQTSGYLGLPDDWIPTNLDGTFPFPSIFTDIDLTPHSLTIAGIISRFTLSTDINVAPVCLSGRLLHQYSGISIRKVHDCINELLHVGVLREIETYDPALTLRFIDCIGVAYNWDHIQENSNERR